MLLGDGFWPPVFADYASSQYHPRQRMGQRTLLIPPAHASGTDILMSASSLRNQLEFFADLHRLRPPFRCEFLEQAARMCLHGILTDKESLRDFAITQAAGNQLKYLQLARGDAELLKLELVKHERLARRHMNLDRNFDRHFFDDNFVLRELQSQPAPHARKKNRNRSEEHTSELQSRFGISYAVF